METRANYAIIGIFTLAVIAAAFGFVYWFSGRDSGTKKAGYRVEFTGSVAGLTKGSPVLFNGIRVGDVTDVSYAKESPDLAYATIEVQPDTPIKSDTRADLSANLLSGTAVVALTGGQRDAPPLPKPPPDQLPTIVAEQGGLGSLLETARGTASKANQLLDSVNGILTSNRQAIDRTLHNVELFSDALGRNAPGLDRLLASLGQAADHIGPVAVKLEKLTDDVDAVVQSLDSAKLNRIVDNTDRLMQTVGDNRQQVADLMQNAAILMRDLSGMAPKLDKTVGDLSRVVAAIDPDKLKDVVANASTFTAALANASGTIGSTLRNADLLMQTVGDNRQKIADVLQDGSTLVRSLADTAPKLDQAVGNLGRVAGAIDPVKLNDVVANADRFTTALSNSSGNVEATLRNANSMTDKLNRSADRIDGVLEAAENFLGSAAGQEGKSTFASIRGAADSIRKLADNLDKRTAEITAGLSKLSGTGARQLDAISGDTRKTVNDIGRAARHLDRDPQSLIFGGGRASLPEYNGR